MASNQLKSLSEIFNQSFFRIPDYQRGYAWGDKQLKDFWDDLTNLEDGTVHYTGLITVEPVSKEAAEKTGLWNDDLWMFNRKMKGYYVIDGQQRLTTIIIALNEILSRYNDEDLLNGFEEVKFLKKKYLYVSLGDGCQSYIFGYENNNPSDEYFKTKILMQNSATADKEQEETLYNQNLRYAKAFFNEKLKEISDEKIDELFSKIVNSLKFNFYEIDDELSVYVTFETMNNRGKDLSKLELLKNRLIYLSTKLHNVDELGEDEFETKKSMLRKDINEVWKTIYSYLGKNPQNVLDDDRFLLLHWIMYFKYDRSESEAYAKFLLDEHFTIKAVYEEKIDLADIKNYIMSLGESVKVWYYMNNPPQLTNYPNAKIFLEKLYRLGYRSFIPLIMASMVKRESEDIMIDLLKACERFNFLVFELTNRISTTRNNEYYRCANDYYWDKRSLEKIVDQIKFETDGYNDKGEYCGWYDKEKFGEYIRDKFIKSDGFYRWDGLKYFLFEYELYLQKKATGDPKVTWNFVKKPNSIEHIYPQTDDDPYWVQQFGSFKENEKKVIKNSLGNLLLISQSKNAKLQNASFPDKKIYSRNGEKFGYAYGSYSEIEVSQNSNWTNDNIKQRGIQMLEFMEQEWNIQIENKEKILGF